MFQLEDLELAKNVRGQTLKRKKLRPNATPTKEARTCCPHPIPADEAEEFVERRNALEHAYVRRDFGPPRPEPDEGEDIDEEQLPAWMETNDVVPTGPVLTAPLPPGTPPPPYDPVAEKDAEIARLKKERDDALSRLNNVMTSLKKIWGDDQIKLFLGDTKRVKEYEDLTIEKCIEIKLNIGTTAYEFLRDKGYPFVSVRVLNRSLKHIKISPGISTDAMELIGMKAKSMALKDVPEEDRDAKTPEEILQLALDSHLTEACVVIDEFSLTQMVEWDPSNKCLSGYISCPEQNDPDHLSGKQSTIFVKQF